MTAAPYAHFPPATAPYSAPGAYGGLTVEHIPREAASDFDLTPRLADWREDWRQALLWEATWEADPCL
jgi:hypothetical protein